MMNRSREFANYLMVVRIISILINLVAATLTYFYFRFVEFGLTEGGIADSVVFSPAFFAAIMVVTMLLALSLIRPYQRAISRDMRLGLERMEIERTRRLAGKVFNVPALASGTSLVAWMAAGLVYGLMPFFHPTAYRGEWPEALRVFVGIVLVGAPFTVVSLFFILEWKTRTTIQRLFEREVLETVPMSLRLNVLPKMLVVSVMTGTVPVTVVSFMTLFQIYQIQAGRQSTANFLDQMPNVIAFLLFLALIIAIGLSLFLARSVSDPLRGVEKAMEEIGKGNLNVRIPVVANDEIGFMSEGFNRMVEGLQERDFIRDTFGTYLSPEVVSEILKSKDGMNLGGALREITILVADLRGFTPLSASLGPALVVNVLNHFLHRMVHIITDHDGTIDEFTGDGILAFFGAPRHLADSQLSAVRCAWVMQEAVPELNRELAQLLPEAHQGAEVSSRNEGAHHGAVVMPSLEMGIAINCGELIVGNIGCEERKKYSAVGTPINMAFRMEKQSRGGEITISSEVYHRVAEAVQAVAVPDVTLSGINDPVTLYKVVGLKDR
ncbi:MAG: adenylate/guanylate cyclase domain-containing protein [Deltaproteobacteria bacterium]|nr:adenylate/guanylate cyclase domain-containing protein [Deltaproteobacteria bacterium]